MGEPVTASVITTGITTFIKIFEVTYQLKAVCEQTADLLDTTQHVQLNIREARRLRRLKDSLLNAGERAWMDRVIEDTENAVRAVAQLIEPSRVGMQTEQRIQFATKAVWVFRDSPKVRDKFARLSVCHQSLNTVVACLYSRDVVVVAPILEEEKKEPPPPYDPQVGELFSWRQNNRRRKKGSTSSKTDSVVSLTLTSPTSSMASPEMSAITYSESAAKGQEGFQISESLGFNWATPSYSLPAATYSPPNQGQDGLQACEGFGAGWSRQTSPRHNGLQVCEGPGVGSVMADEGAAGRGSPTKLLVLI